MSVYSIVSSLASQVASGKPVWKVALPASIHGTRSAIENPFRGMFSNAHALRNIQRINLTGMDEKERISLLLSAICDRNIDWSGEKPFNPILGEFLEASTLIDGETYSYCIEQVSHHPPIACFRMTGPNFVLENPEGVDATSGFKPSFNHVDVVMDSEIRLTMKDLTMTCGSPGIRIEPIFGSNRTVGFQGDLWIEDTTSGMRFEGKITKRGFKVEGVLKNKEGEIIHKVGGAFDTGITFLETDEMWTPPLDKEELTLILSDEILNDSLYSHNVWKETFGYMRETPPNFGKADIAKHRVEETQRELAKKNKKEGIAFVSRYNFKISGDEH